MTDKDLRVGNAPAVSVVMPVYNAEKYLHESLEGLLSQTFCGFEVICIDDGSSDRSLSILNEYAAQDPCITVLTQDHAYAGAARNLGIRHAAGKYLLFLDADDRFLPQMLELSVKRAEEAAADICVFPAEGFDDRTGKIFALPTSCQPGPKQQTVFSRTDDPDHIFSFTHPAPWNKLFRREFILEQGLEFQNTRSVNDLAFVLTALAAASRITTVGQPLLQYRTNNKESLQGSQQKAPLAFYDALTEFRNRLSARDLYKPLERAFINQAASDTFYNLGTIRSAVPFEETYNFIKNRVLKEFCLSGHPDDFFYVLPDWRIPERIRVMEEESILDYTVKFRVRIPELQRAAIKKMGLKDLAGMVLDRIRSFGRK